MATILTTIQTKTCIKCKAEKDLKCFGRHIKALDGLDSNCKPCKSKISTAWKLANPDKVRLTKRRYLEKHPERKLLRRLVKYGITIAQYQMMVLAQGGLCKICGNSSSTGELHIDHDHATNEVRGLLCSICNKALGLFRDSPRLLRFAAEYLENGRAHPDEEG